MPRYIEIDKAIPLMIQACADIVGHGITQVDAVRIAEILEDASTENVTPKKHGTWKLVGNGNGRVIHWKCSACGFETFDAINGDTNFCPHCGAEM